MSDKEEKLIPQNEPEDNKEKHRSVENSGPEIKNAHAAGNGTMERNDQKIESLVEKKDDSGLKGGDEY